MAPGFLVHLGLDADADERAIKRAYARKLKAIDQALEPEAFQSLREAYEVSLQWIKQRALHVADSQGSQDSHISGADEHAAHQPMPPSLPADAEAAAHSPSIEETSHVDSLPEDAQPEVFVNPEDEIVAQYLVAFRAFCDDMVSRDQTSDDIPWQIELRRLLSSPEFDSMYARGLFEAHLVHQLADGWRPGHQTLFMAAMSVFKWVEEPHRLNMFGPAGGIIDRAVWQYTMFDELRGTPQYQAVRALIARLRDAKPPTTKEVLANAALLEMVIANYPTWLAIISNVHNIETWREQDKRIPAWRRRVFQFIHPNGGREPIWQKLRRHWLTVLIVAFVLYGALMASIDASKLASDPYKNASGDEVIKAGAEGPHADWMAAIREKVFFVPPSEIKGNPTVEYRVRLFKGGSIMRTELAKSSGWQPFDDAVLRGIKASERFSDDVPRDFVLIFKMFPDGPPANGNGADKNASKQNSGVRYLIPPRPIYPPLAQIAGIEGVVTLRVLVGATGAVENVEIHTSSGDDRLDQAGIEAVKKAAFRPYIENGKPMPAYALIPINFSSKIFSKR